MNVRNGLTLASTLVFLASMLCPTADAQVLSSHFDTDDEGWSIIGYDPYQHTGVPAGSAVTYDPGFGNPGGSIRAGDVYWGTAVAAPASFLGDRRAYFGGSLDYDIYLRHVTLASLTSALLVSTDHTLYFVEVAPTVSTWTSRSFPLAPGGWRFDSSTGPFATAEQLLAVLADLKGVWITTEWAVGFDDTNVDNPALVPPAAGAVVPFGTTLNPADSLTRLSGTTQLGQTLTLGIDDPLGQKPIGALSFLVISTAPQPNFPSGTLLPGFGMGGASTAGELLVDLSPTSMLGTVLVGLPWTGPGNPAPFALPIPTSPVLVGLCVYAQGALLDFGPTGSIGLTNASMITLGV